MNLKTMSIEFIRLSKAPISKNNLFLQHTMFLGALDLLVRSFYRDDKVNYKSDLSNSFTTLPSRPVIPSPVIAEIKTAS